MIENMSKNMLIVVLLCIIATIYAVTPKSLHGSAHMERIMMEIMDTSDVRLQPADLNSRRLQTTSYNTPTAYLAYSFYPK
jgi:S-adenosylmethionine/arginine decarboxylase-like enzyme